MSWTCGYFLPTFLSFISVVIGGGGNIKEARMLLPQLNQPPYFLSMQHVVLLWCFQTLCLPLRAGAVKKHWFWGINSWLCFNCARAWQRLTKMCPKFWSAIVGMSGAVERSSLHPVHCTAVTSHSKVTCAAQKSGQRHAQIVQSMPRFTIHARGVSIDGGPQCSCFVNASLPIGKQLRGTIKKWM